MAYDRHNYEECALWHKVTWSADALQNEHQLIPNRLPQHKLSYLSRDNLERIECSWFASNELNGR